MTILFIECTCDLFHSLLDLQVDLRAASVKILYRITGCGPSTLFQERQHLKWLAHCVRMDNSCLQKQTLFMETTDEEQ